MAKTVCITWKEFAGFKKLIQVSKMLLRHLFKIVPFQFSLFSVIYINKRLCHLLPPGHTIEFSGYYNSLRVRVNTTYSIERQMLSGIYDAGTVKVLEQFIRPGDVCIDVGANVGALTLVMASLVGNKGKVFAFEPGPELFAKLQQNVWLNKNLQHRVGICQCGLSDEEALLCWEEDAGNRGNAFLSKSQRGLVVPVKRLDDIPEVRGTNVSFIKIDVEGMELRVLRGAKDLLLKTRCLVYFEAMPGARRRKQEEDHEDIFCGIRQFFEQAGYKIFGLSKSGQLEPVQGAKFCQNNLALPNEMKFFGN
jgi:FkbM family methyltransferase